MKTAKRVKPAETLAVKSERLVDVITKLNREGRRILSATVVAEDRYTLTLGRRKTKPKDTGPEPTNGDTTP